MSDRKQLKKPLKARMRAQTSRHYSPSPPHPPHLLEQGLKAALLMGALVAIWSFSRWGLARAAVIALVWYELTYLSYCFLSAMRDIHNRQKLENRWSHQTRITQLEGELGLPVVMVGECWNCHKPLAAGAKFCTYCGRPSERPTAKVCVNCQTRNPLDGIYCIECAAILSDVT